MTVRTFESYSIRKLRPFYYEVNVYYKEGCLDHDYFNHPVEKTVFVYSSISAQYQVYKALMMPDTGSVFHYLRWRWSNRKSQVVRKTVLKNSDRIWIQSIKSVVWPKQRKTDETK